MKPIFALLLAAGAATLPACSDSSDNASDDPAPVAETSLQRELHYGLPQPAPNGDTAMVVRTRYETQDIQGSALGPNVPSTYSRLIISLAMPAEPGQLHVTIPSSILSSTWIGDYPLKHGAVSAGGTYTVGNGLRPLIHTNYSSLSRGIVTITQYDSKTQLISGSFNIIQQKVSDPAALAGLPQALQKECTVVVVGTFANLKVYQ
ncbi:hypothetical protein [Hymenobacter lucidus]|uniref:Uncharacterized protein n=1 Tax=Hymenobacter lucidus TaxID=2880930 RepID=A0ABS8AMG1_9BACT|nr:hypothetical protein [Hymenobacter lucidus]MCB2406471.1 hypothetical protein [Hymenobacter lucidus]